MKKSITLIFLMCFIMFATSFKSKDTLLDEQTKTYSDTSYVSIIDKCSITNGIILFDYDGNTYQIDTNIYSYYLTNDGIYTLTDSVGNSNIYYQTDAANQASRYGGYVRTTVIQPHNQSGINCDPILLSCGKNSEAIAQFQFNRANAISSVNYTSSENMHLYAGVSFELVEDNTSCELFHWWKNGRLNIIASGVESTIYMGMLQRVK